MKNLNEVPVDELIEALMERKDELFMKEKPGLLIDSAFKLRMILGAVPCVDGIPYRRAADGQIELMALRRFKGAFPGKLVLEGGTIAKGESVEDALKRHFREDFGVKIEMSEAPLCMTQYRKDESDDQWMQDPAKEHNIAPVYLVQFLGETPAESRLGCIEWLSENSMPPAEEFGYTNERLYRKAFVFLKGKKPE